MKTENKFPSVESLQAERTESLRKLQSIHEDYLERSRYRKYQKGAEVWLVTAGMNCAGRDTSRDGGHAAWVRARRVTLTSLGARQGTATHREDGRNVLTRIYRNHTLLLETRQEVGEYAAQVGPLHSRIGELGAAYCSLANRPNLLPDYVEACDDRVSANLRNARNPLYNLTFTPDLLEEHAEANPVIHRSDIEMSTRITPNLARVFGLRVGCPLDEKLASLLVNPKSVCRERFVYSRGLCCVFVGGLRLDSVGCAGDGMLWLMRRAEQLPELPHLKRWAEGLKIS